MFNPALYPLAKDDEFLVYQMTLEFRKKWPQFNEQTKIELTQHSSVYIREFIAPLMPDMILTPIPAWQQFKYWLLRKPIPDDYDGRWTWQKTLFTRAVNIPRYALMRKIGKLFNRPGILLAAMELTINPTSPIERNSETKIILEPFGWQDRHEFLTRYQRPPMIYFRAGYHPARDTLFVQQRG